MKKNLISIALIVLMFLLASCGGDKKITVYPVQIGDHWGYVNEKGKYIVNPTFDSADYFSCGRARYSENGLIGYIDSNGRKAIEAVYSQGTTFSEEKAFVVRDGEELECINTKGEVLFSLEGVKKAYNFHESLSRIIDKGGKYKYVNDKGEVVLESKYQLCGDFHEGLAFVWNSDTYGFINKNGEIVISLEPHVVSGDFYEGLSVLYDFSHYGFVDKTGDITIPFQFDGAFLFSEGLALVQTGGKCGYIDKKGQYVINPQYDDCFSFSEGLAAVRLGGKYGYIDNKGKMVIEPIYSYACNFVGGYAFVENSDGLYGIINKKGDYVVDPQFTKAKSYDETNEISSENYIERNSSPSF